MSCIATEWISCCVLFRVATQAHGVVWCGVCVCVCVCVLCCVVFVCACARFQDCTFKPQIHDAPAYIKRIARSMALTKAARPPEPAPKPDWR
mgnify:CR=1 FL=1